MNKVSFDSQSIHFIGFGEDYNLSKKDIMGEQLWNKIFERKIFFGGYLVGLFGIMGSGKTSLMHQMAKRIIRENPDEIIFWRESLNSPLQAANFPGEFQVLCERRYPVKIMQLLPNSMKRSDLEPRLFTGFNELMRLVKPGMLNVVFYDKPWMWIKLMDKLKQRASWQTIFVDEMEDITPERARGKEWDMNNVFTTSIKEIRKSRVNLIYNTQNSMDVWHGVINKTMIHFYLYGSRSNEFSPVFKAAIQNLKVGSGWIDYGHSLFGLINFKPVYPKGITYIVVPTGRRKG